MHNKWLYLALAAFLILQSCSLKQQHVLFEQKKPGAPDTVALQPPGPYRIKPDDVLQVRNLQNVKTIADEGSGGSGGGGAAGQTLQVEEDGTIALPGIGHVNVAGLTRYQAAKRIEKIYRDSVLTNPIIELKITNLKVTLMGEVNSPGNIPLVKDRTTLIDVLGAAGGLTKNANEKNVKIIRGEKDHQQVTWVDLSDISTINDPRIVLQNNDVIYIAQNKRAVRDDKLQNFTTLAQPSLLILNTALIIYSLFR